MRRPRHTSHSSSVVFTVSWRPRGRRYTAAGGPCSAQNKLTPSSDWLHSEYFGNQLVGELKSSQTSFCIKDEDIKSMFKAFIDQCRRFNQKSVGTLLLFTLSVFSVFYVVMTSTPKICQDAECGEPKLTAAVCFSRAQMYKSAKWGSETCRYTLNVSALLPVRTVGGTWKASPEEVFLLVVFCASHAHDCFLLF